MTDPQGSAACERCKGRGMLPDTILGESPCTSCRGSGSANVAALPDNEVRPGSAARLTAPQLLALRVAHDAGRAVKTWRNASRAEPTPYINFRAADSLDRLGLLRLRLSDGRYGYYEVTCTAAGCAVLAEVTEAR